MSELKRLDKQNALSDLCSKNKHDESCPLYGYCTEVEAPFAALTDASIDRLYKDYIINPQCEVNVKQGDQEAKADAGKAEIRLVPMEIVWAIAWIRMYGNRKYGDPENWKTVEPERYRDALMRHLLAYISDPKSVDEESGYPHLWHAACNMAFLMHFDYGDMCHYDLGKAIDGQHHWTPCSSKLPDKEGEYLVTNDAGGMKNVEIDTFAHYEDDGKPFWMTSQNPIAWMPIPDVYEKKEEKYEQ